MKLNKDLFHKTVLDAVGPLLERVKDQMAEAQQAALEQHKEQMLTLFKAQHQTATASAPMDADAQTKRAARFIRLLASADGNIDRAIQQAKDWGDEGMVKALGESTLAGGGALVPEDMAAGVIEFLRARTVVRALGATQVPMANGTLTLPFLNQGATASYTGESVNIAKSEQDFGQLVLTARKLAVLTPISNELLADASERVDALVRDDLVQAARVREDVAFIRGDGASSTPKGMLSWSQEKFNANAANDVQSVTNDLAGAIQRLEDNNIPMNRLGWIFDPRTKKALMSARGTDGQLVFAPEMGGGSLMGIPFATTTSIPRNLGGGSDESEVYLADFSQLLIGETADMDVRMFDGATYYDGAQLQSGVSRDETVVRLTMRHDFGPRFRGDEIVVIQQVKWDSIAP